MPSRHQDQKDMCDALKRCRELSIALHCAECRRRMSRKLSLSPFGATDSSFNFAFRPPYHRGMEQYYRSVISGERAGAWPAILRTAFAMASVPYGMMIDLRNSCYDKGTLRVHRLGVPVISVGNLTTGGTGKTPTVILLVKLLQEMGLRPAVLTRGYGAAKGKKSDEVLVIEQNCPGVPVVVDGDRVAGGRRAIGEFGADVLVLDDGFQHRRLHRDLNIVLCDATEPMGIKGILPRGTWREPPASMARADMIMLTRCEQVTEELADLAGGLLSQWVEPRMIFKQYTRVVGLFDSVGHPVSLDSAKPLRVIAFAGIGNPAGFLNTLRGMGLHVSAACWFGDHHDYALPRDFARLVEVTRGRQIDAWVTTQKDMVKLEGAAGPVPIYQVKIESVLAAGQEEHLREAIREVVGGGDKLVSNSETLD